jgi:16S rRNA (guanine966-N2)-methyltransferase
MNLVRYKTMGYPTLSIVKSSPDIFQNYTQNPADMNRKKTGNAKHQIRIIGGQWRGRKLPVPDLPGLRPTGDRQRETLFNWLSPYLDGARVLDAFAGSGALGFEALSRGASYALLLENSSEAVANLKECISLLDAEANASIQCQDALAYFNADQLPESDPFDLVFLDPPFSASLIKKSIVALDSGSLLSNHSLVYLEQNRRDHAPLVPENWSVYREKSSGEVSCFLYQVEKA